MKMKIILTAFFALMSLNSFAKWDNLITCDEGLRIDVSQGWKKQIVIYGDALNHFIKTGDIPSYWMNEDGEYVRDLMEYDSYFIAAGSNGGRLKIQSQLKGKVDDLRITSKNTSYDFYRCH